MNFQDQLRKQLGFIETSCREYDLGNPNESFRIATAIRVIFHQTSQSISLLQHLQSSYIEMLSTWESISKENTPIPGLTNMQMVLDPLSMTCVPKLTMKGRIVSKNYWWQEEAILVRGTKKFRRKDFMHWGANKDGGAHVDAFPVEYQEILDGMGWSIQMKMPDGSIRNALLQNGAVATLRQMGFEVLNSPQLRNLAGL